MQSCIYLFFMQINLTYLFYKISIRGREWFKDPEVKKATPRKIPKKQEKHSTF